MFVPRFSHSRILAFPHSEGLAFYASRAELDSGQVHLGKVFNSLPQVKSMNISRLERVAKNVIFGRKIL